jgi:hypothetical protein
MDSHASKAGWDVVLFGIPLIAFLIFGFFRLDEVFTSRKHGNASSQSPVPPNEGNRKSMRSDPDGHPWDDR